MNRTVERNLSKRVVELGNAGKVSALSELLDFLGSPYFHVRRLAVSAIGKFAGIAEPAEIIPSLINMLQDKHPQVRQYAIKALSAYGEFSKQALVDLREIVSSPIEKDYNRRDAENAISAIEEACKIADREVEKACSKCGKKVESDEFARSMKVFSRIYCDHCFDEVYIMRRNYDTKVDLNKTIKTTDGKLVQSDGERIIANFLHSSKITYRYDERIRIIEGYAIRPDFYLPEFDLYIEYWGMDTIDYKIGMLMKRKLYQQQEKKLVSVSFKDKANLVEVLRQKLRRYINI